MTPSRKCIGEEPSDAPGATFSTDVSPAQRAEYVEDQDCDLISDAPGGAFVADELHDIQFHVEWLDCMSGVIVDEYDQNIGYR